MPTLPSSLSCVVNDNCLGFKCCANNIDLIVAQRSLQVYLTVDPCNFVISVGFGAWSLDMPLFTYQWGTDETVSLGTAFELR